MNDKKEAIWFVVVTCIGMLFLIIFQESNALMTSYTKTGEGEISAVLWALTALHLALSALVPYLLSKSEPLDFRISAILLTSIAPAAGTVFVVFNVWHVTYV